MGFKYRFTWPKVEELHVKGKGKKAKRYVNLYVNRGYKVSILLIVL
jgi:hypothetical protein